MGTPHVPEINFERSSPQHTGHIACRLQVFTSIVSSVRVSVIRVSWVSSPETPRPLIGVPRHVQHAKGARPLRIGMNRCGLPHVAKSVAVAGLPPITPGINSAIGAP